MARSHKTIVAGIVLVSALLAQDTFAGKSCMGTPEAETKPASNKLWRGVVNTFTGVGEIIRQPIVCTKTDGLIGVPVGLLNGVVMAFVRTGSGLMDVFTFIVPFDDEIGYNSLINPDYVWQKAD